MYYVAYVLVYDKIYLLKLNWKIEIRLLWIFMRWRWPIVFDFSFKFLVSFILYSHRFSISLYVSKCIHFISSIFFNSFWNHYVSGLYTKWKKEVIAIFSIIIVINDNEWNNIERWQKITKTVYINPVMHEFFSNVLFKSKFKWYFEAFKAILHH